MNRALLIGVYMGAPEKTLCEEHLDELESLASTYGVETDQKLPVALRRVDPATFLSKGKLEEVRAFVAGEDVDVVIFDEEISPAQQRNLEKALGIGVMDRTELILEIFAKRAHTKEAKLQIDLARTKYEFPRLKRLWSHLSRQRAGGGFLGGEGEKQIEIDRRLLKDKIEKLTRQLKQVKQVRQTQAQARRRTGIPTLALIGYTNAGKSSLLRALTEADVFVEDKLFATLDPTTRKFTLPNNQEILLTDTVGFIRKLPHTLVAAFRSTLEAALHDDILLHVIDVSHPMAEEQAETTLTLLEELGAHDVPIITVLNKSDLLDDPALFTKFRIKFPKAVLISALQKEGFDELWHLIIKELEKRRALVKLRIPQSEYVLVSELHREGRVIQEEYEGNDVSIRAEVPIQLLHKYNKYIE